MIPATSADRAEIEAFLAPRAAVAMFPLSNLRHYGMAGGHDLAVRFWISRQGGQISDLLCQSEAGMVMPVLPSQDYAAAAGALAGRKVIGLIGPRAWVRGLSQAANLAEAPATLDRDEPHYRLDLAALHMPEGPGRIVPLAQAPAEVIRTWIRDYMVEALATPPARAEVEVEERYRRYLQADSHICLIEGDVPLAMSGFNARLPDMVQVGGVYTPPALRGRGHARRALALHLQEARAAGASAAILFAANPAASRAYQALGFRQIGDWALLLLESPQVIHV